MRVAKFEGYEKILSANTLNIQSCAIYRQRDILDMYHTYYTDKETYEKYVLYIYSTTPGSSP